MKFTKKSDEVMGIPRLALYLRKSHFQVFSILKLFGHKWIKNGFSPAVCVYI